MKESYAKAKQKMTNMPKFLEKLQQIIRERGQMPPWMEEFIEPVEVSEKESDDEESDLMKEIMREIVIRATETDSDDEVITDMEDDNENGENYDELEERQHMGKRMRIMVGMGMIMRSWR